jgi:hypothetical protein
MFTGEIVREDRVSGGLLIAGLLPDAGGHNLLPSTFTAALQSAPSTNDPVRLGDAAAYRYRGLSATGVASSLTLLVAPSTAGVIGIACLPPETRASVFLASCEAVADTLSLAGAKALGLGPNPAYGRSLSTALSSLRDAESISRSLASAQTRAGQALLSRRLAQVELTGAAKLATAKPGPDARTLNTDLIKALRTAGNGYASMADAASRGQSKLYSSSRAMVSRGLADIRRQLAALQALGYGT